MCNLCNDSKFTLMHKQVTGLVVLAQHHIGDTGAGPNLARNLIWHNYFKPLEVLLFELCT